MVYSLWEISKNALNSWVMRTSSLSPVEVFSRVTVALRSFSDVLEATSSTTVDDTRPLVPLPELGRVIQSQPLSMDTV